MLVQLEGPYTVQTPTLVQTGAGKRGRIGYVVVLWPAWVKHAHADELNEYAFDAFVDSRVTVHIYSTLPLLYGVEVTFLDAGVKIRGRVVQ